MKIANTPLASTILNAQNEARTAKPAEFSVQPGTTGTSATTQTSSGVEVSLSPQAMASLYGAPEASASKRKVELQLTGVAHQGAAKVDIRINGVLVKSGHEVTAELARKQKEMLTLEGDFGRIESIEVSLTNDNGPRRVDVLGATIDGKATNISSGQVVRRNGDVMKGANKLFWNATYRLPVNEPAPVVVTKPAEPTRPEASLWDGVNTARYRGAAPARSRETESAVTGTVVDIPAGTSVQEITAKIAAVPENKPMTLRFAAGEHRFTERLLIQRGNITIEGAGKDQTTFVAAFAQGEVDNLIQIQGPDIRNDAGSNNGRWMPERGKLATTAAGEFITGDTSMTVADASELKVGDRVMIHKLGTANTTDDNDEFGTLTEIAAIDGNKLTFTHKLAFGSDQLSGKNALSDVKLYRTDLLENVTVRDFSIRYDIPDSALLNPKNLPVRDIRNTTQNFYPDYAAASSGALGNVQYGHHRALVVSGTHEANVSNIAMEDVGSNGFFFSGNLELAADDLSVDGTMNKGAGGNGYGLEYDKTYYSDFTNLEFEEMRHGISANVLGGNGYNNFHVKKTDSNVDFHGGRDQGNIYYVEEIDIRPYYLPSTAKGNKLAADIAYDYGKVQFSMISFRKGPVNGEENTVLFGKAAGTSGEFVKGTQFKDLAGAFVQAFHGNNNDRLTARENGSKLDGGFGNDELIGGRGNDVFTGGAGLKDIRFSADTFVTSFDGGQDTVTDFDAFDKLVIALKDATVTAADLLKQARQNGSDVVLDLAEGSSVTLKNRTLNDLKADQLRIIKALV